MAHEKCRTCEYWVVKREDTFCPNCGTAEPFVSKKTVEEWTDLQGCLFLLIWVGIAVGSAYYGAKVYGWMGAVGFGLTGTVAGAVLAVVPPGLLDSWRTAKYKKTAPRWLKQDEDLIRKRLEELRRNEDALRSAIEHIKTRNVADELKDMVGMLEQTLEETPAQRKRYEVQLWAIELVRRQNAFEPLRADWETLTDEECGTRFTALSAARKECEVMKRKWEEQTELLELPEARQCFIRLEALLDAVEKLSQSLIAKRALLIVKGLTPLGDAGVPPDPALEPDQLDLFNARVAANEFSTTFKELEYEYARLQSERELLLDQTKPFTQPLPKR